MADLMDDVVYRRKRKVSYSIDGPKPKNQRDCPDL
jgi:hypothetical protein